MPYITVQQLADNLGGLATDDPRAQRVVDAASTAIDNYCRRNFTVPTDTSDRDYLIGESTGTYVHDIANTTGLALQIDTTGKGDSFTAATVADYRWLPLNRLNAAGVYWPHTEIRAIDTPFTLGSLIRVTAQWGWDAVPVDVREATLLIAGQLLERHKSASGLVGIDVGAPAFVSRSLDANAQALLAPYRRYP